MIPYYVDLQNACQTPIPVSDEQLEAWVLAALKPFRDEAELTLRCVDPSEMTALNSAYRQQNKPTNVLSFPATYPPNIEMDQTMIGDIIICPDVLQDESNHLGIPLEAHWAHIVIHGVLHLLGYDHILDEDAEIMRPLEIGILNMLGYDNPYTTEDPPLE